jgi:hypothetical protein
MRAFTHGAACCGTFLVLEHQRFRRCSTLSGADLLHRCRYLPCRVMQDCLDELVLADIEP